MANAKELGRIPALRIEDWEHAWHEPPQWELAWYLASQLETLHPDGASAARILRELVRSQRVG
jgi:hypothetical protein